jgi:hypothetical protein
MLNEMDFWKHYKFNQVSIKPEVQVLDINGSPMKGKKCILFTGMESILGSEKGSYGAMNGLKYFNINNSVSEATGDDGVCKFKDV